MSPSDQPPLFDVPPRAHPRAKRSAAMALIRRDAAEVRGMLAASKWRKALLIARSVHPGAGQGRRSDLAPNDEKSAPLSAGPHESLKVSARTFAREVGVQGWSEHTVARHLAAWARAAEAGLVPPPDELIPGEDVPLPDAEWADFYDGSGGPRPSKPEPVPVVTEPVNDNAAEAAVVTEVRQPAPARPRLAARAASSVNILWHAVDRVRAAGPFADGSAEADEVRRAALALLDTIEATVEEATEGAAGSAPQPGR